MLLAWECGTGKGWLLGWVMQALLGSEVPWPSFLDGAAGMHCVSPCAHSLPPALPKAPGHCQEPGADPGGPLWLLMKPRVPSSLVVVIAGNHSN